MTAGWFPLFVSTSYIGLTSLIAFWLRKFLDRFVPHDSLPKLLIQELIAAGELCACCFELIIVADNYGVSMYALYLFFLTVWWSLCWDNATACPYTHLEDIVEGNVGVFAAGAKVFSEMAGGLLIFKYIQFLWSLEIASTHKGRAFEECTADLQVNPILGALIEGICTCICRIEARALSEVAPRLSVALDAFIGTSLVVAAFNYSGGYFNPVLATSLKYGCLGNTTAEHLIVYWVGACGGSIASIFLYNHPKVQAIINKLKPKRD